METHRKFWNEQQKKLRQALTSLSDIPAALELFLRQHAMVHSSIMSGMGLWSFTDEISDGIDDDDFRYIPTGEEHSLVWIFWHLSRIEDVTLNLLIAGTSQVIERENWSEQLGIPYGDTGNSMDFSQINSLSAKINVQSLYQYRISVGRSTREIVNRLTINELKKKVDSSRLERVLKVGAVDRYSQGLLDYWGGLTYGGLLLMPPTRHNFVHLNEAKRIKSVLKKAVR